MHNRPRGTVMTGKGKGMDGMTGMPSGFSPASLSSPSSAPGKRQVTLKSPIDCVGHGLHSGAPARLRLIPAAPGTGIVFRRTDLGFDIPAAFDNVTDTRLCTLLTAPDCPDAHVGTVEHLMAALAAQGIDNLLIEIDGPEVPILDGSAAPFMFLIDCAGVEEQSESRLSIKILKPVRVEAGNAFAELHPAESGFSLSLSIEFDAAAIGRQALTMTMDTDNFRHDLANARTFTMAKEIEAMRAAGLARGGSLDNAIVVDGDQVLNPEGLRMPDEFVRHKLLDVVGDLAMAGHPLIGRFVGHRTGHALNNRLLHALLSDASAWQTVSANTMDWLSAA
ncbi:UDP-3-O-[3-hydroxymyristoyl] N-acetylglucosamine deacetylase [Granulibacter bethesdensis CGDNIH4]|nr:UDP-3-O-[3-hydroxymyristoyl] N-acetylglucosamine deacetylase [Granulibacter bethesdensis CGDNIH4]